MLRVAVSNMASAIRLSLFEKGLDPAGVALVSFGGASSLHACDTATDLNIRTVMPRDQVRCRQGMLWSDITQYLSIRVDAGLQFRTSPRAYYIGNDRSGP